MKTLLFTLLVAFFGMFSSLRAQTGTLSGLVRDAKTGIPLAGATVSIDKTEIRAATDSAGRYFLQGIRPGTYNLSASYIGYADETLFNIVIRSEGNPDLNFELLSQSVTLGEVVVRPNPFRKPASTPLSVQQLSQEEVASYPGGNNDIAKVLQSFPGVSGSIGGFRNDVIIRGGAPNENVYYLDGIEIPNINHFSTQGSAGGPVGLLNVSFIENVTLSTSAFGAQYDNVLSGIIQFDQRNGNNRRFQGNFRLGSSEAALTAEGPIGKKGRESSNTTYLVSVRRSYLQLLFRALGLPFLPDYWDYQFKVNHRINARNEISITGVGSIDDFKINELKSYDPEQQAIQDQVPVIRQRTNTMGVSWKNRFKDRKGQLQVSLSQNRLKNEFLQYSDNVRQTGLYFSNDSREEETRLRTTVTRFMGKWTGTFGFVLLNARYKNITSDLVNNAAYNSGLNFLRYGLFAQASSRLLDDRLGISLGIRFDGNSFSDKGNQVWRTFSPRASLSYRLTESGSWTFNLALGRYYKIPPYTILGYQDNNGIYKNRDARYIGNDQLTAGFEFLLSPSSRITLEGFYKYYRNYPVSVRDSVSLANKGAGFEVLGNEPVQSVGRGKTYGAEFLFQQKFNGKLYAIASVTVYSSQFTGFQNTRFISSAWDNRVLISLLAGYKLKKNWEISARYRYLGGSPYAPVNEDATLAAYPAIIRDYSRLGSVRLGNFSQPDIRVTKQWSFKKFSLDVFLDIQNFLGTQLPQEPRYGLDRDKNGQIIQPRTLVVVPPADNTSVLPSVGIVVNF